ncbi:MAG: metallo-beta-lactamase family protein [Marivirga sp.]|jgi:metallo-beta-lactamase family protein
MDVRLKFLGGAQSVTGSKYLLEIDNYKCMVDCGLFQGLKKLRLRNWDNLPIDISTIDSILLTHAHLDHSGYIPRLVKDGFTGPIYCTESTASLLEILWLDSAKLQKEEAEFAKRKGYSKHKNPEALYTEKDVISSLDLIKAIPFEKEITLTQNINIIFYPAGHILGAASIQMQVIGDRQNKVLLFSGDLGRQSDPIMFPPSTFQSADIVLLESTYGNRKNIPLDTINELADQINTTIKQGVVLIPAFTIGRTQNLLFMLKQLIDRKLIPKIPVYIDSPMAISVTTLYEKFEKEHKLGNKEVFNCPQFHYIREHDHSAALKEIQNNAIIISASGMVTGGRILNHLFHRIGNKDDLLLFVGYQAEGTRGRRMLDGEEEIKIFGELKKIRCKTHKITGLSAHADQTELINWYRHLKSHPKYTFIIHGEKDASETLSKLISPEYPQNIIVPKYLESFDLFNHI